MSKSLGTDNYFAITPEWVLYAKISANAKVIYGALQRHADKAGDSFPSRARLAALCSCSVRTVDKCIAELESIGALIKQRRLLPQDNEKQWHSNLYTVITTPGAKSAPGGSAENSTTTSAENVTGGSARNSTLIRAIPNQSHLNQELSPEQRAVAAVAVALSLNDDDEKLISVPLMLKNNNAKKPLAFISSCARSGDLERLLDDAHGELLAATQNTAEVNRRRCPHGIVNGLSAGQCIECCEATYA
jgi:biotin operon repressor